MQTRYSGQYDDNDDLTRWVVGMVWAIVLINVGIFVCLFTGVIQ